MGAQPKVGGKWSVMEVAANGPQLTVVLNGEKTVEVRDTKLASGPDRLAVGTWHHQVPQGRDQDSLTS